MFDVHEFRSPGEQFRGVDFWMLNDALDDDSLRFQLRQMRQQGVSSFIARTYIGLKSDYPGPGFKAKLRTVVETARELGLKIYLQAGYMPEAVVGLPPEYAASYVEEKDGRYTLERTEIYVDMLNPEAVRCYLRQAYEEMWAEFAPEFGRTILSVWVDEPNYSKTGVPWTAALGEKFRARSGSEVDFAALFHDTPGCSEVRYHYWNCVVELLRDAYFKQVRDWCHEHHLLFSGHLMGEATFHANFARGAAMMPFYRYFDVPGIDHLTADLPFRDSPLPRWGASPVYDPDLYITPLQCASAAHQAGCKFMLAEMYGVSSENLALRDQKSMFENFAVFGVNVRSVHGYFYSLRGRGKRAYPPHVGYYQPYWEHYRKLTDECARTAYFITQGEVVAPVLVLLPWNTAATLYARGETGGDGIPALRALENLFLNLIVRLVHGQVAFELGDEFVIADTGAIENGRFRVGCATYSAVVLPWASKLADSTLQLLSRFASTGGAVFALGDTPCPEAQLLAGADLLLTALEPFREFKFDSDHPAALQIRHQREETGLELFFVFNSDCSSTHTVTPDRPCAEVLSDGTCRSAATFLLQPGSGLRLITRVAAPATPATPAPRLCHHLCLPDQWQVVRRSPNALVLEFARFRRENDSEFSPDYPILAIHDMLTAEQYHGQLTLRFEINCACPFAGTSLALENPSRQQISLNGEAVSNQPMGCFRAREFETITLPELKAGQNILTLTLDFSPLEQTRHVLTELFANLRGVELEAPFLLGDFGVFSHREPSRTNCVRMSRHFHLAPAVQEVGGELIDRGFPFFAGTLCLRQSFTLERDCTRAVLQIDHFNAAAGTVFLNGVEQAVLAWHPYQAMLTGLRSGENILELELCNSLRNLLGPSHRPDGEFGSCFGGYGHPNKNWIGAVDNQGRKIAEWYNHRTPDTQAWCEGYLQVHFGVAGISVSWEEN
ncbi:MAG: hypothetical protein GX564_04385 [Oligosphaeraceae bacterium]|nr:hypothetical protein [Oligosphaeraceae bacterium]